MTKRFKPGAAVMNLAMFVGIIAIGYWAGWLTAPVDRWSLFVVGTIGGWVLRSTEEPSEGAS